MTSSLPILIAGGGIGGLALALALARSGQASAVLERQPEFAAAGAGIQIGPNGVRALQELGVADAVQPLVGEPEAIVVHGGASGRRAGPAAAGRLDRAAARRALLGGASRRSASPCLPEAAALSSDIALRTGFEVTAVAQRETGSLGHRCRRQIPGRERP